jgi:hypothetical protein
MAAPGEVVGLGAALFGRSTFKEKDIQKGGFDMRSTTGLGAFCAMILATAGLLFAPAANAQTQSPGTPRTTPNTTPAPAAPANISDKKLDAVAAASKQVSAVRGTYEQKVAKAPAAEKERLVGEANAAITKAVTDQGLSIEEYNTIVEVAQKDPAVRDKLLQRMR